MSASIISPEFFKFLRDLKGNNDRDWFAENKSRYEQDVRDPAVEFVRQLEKPLARIAPMLLAVPKRHGGSLMRIYRDTRFSKDKTPYKTNVGISLRHQANKDIHAPGAYIHLDPQECFVGAGCWRPASQVLSAIRAAIDSDPKAWKRARDNKGFRQTFELSGEKLKTSPRDYAKDHPMIDDLRRIDFIAVTPISEAETTGDQLVSLVIDRIKRAKPLMNFLCDAIDVPY
jgi:uncharacterized protein (TIGR02453 family)